MEPFRVCTWRQRPKSGPPITIGITGRGTYPLVTLAEYPGTTIQDGPVKTDPNFHFKYHINLMQNVITADKGLSSVKGYRVVITFELMPYGF